ncbi:hypothetical protein DM01DRAFT_1410405 [Hesseltinella vesiculosa]|uniref:Uncharacterized protein n=1 Tax=Hesseltinella vesiculosa TaxID=101127 RepID=A0A1X2G7F1_9FUNG|nr:hypothetical protein DM01DRAFT_1410405 [Hesseltinella vesiculosa]
MENLSQDDITKFLEIARQLETANITTRNRDRGFDEGPRALPDSIMATLEEASKKAIKSLVESFGKHVAIYEGGVWTQPGATNPQFINELKRANLDVNQVVSRMYKDGERLRRSGRGATEILEDLQEILNDLPTPDPRLELVAEKVEQLAVYGFAGAKRIDQEAREITIKALNIPAYVGHLESIEEDDKDMAFTVEVNRIQEARFEEFTQPQFQQNNKLNNPSPSNNQ